MDIDELNPPLARGCLVQCHVVSPSSNDLWREALDCVDEGSRFLCSKWTALLRDTYGYTPQLIVLRENKRIQAVLPYVIVRSALTGTRAISLPFFDICRAYATDEAFIPPLYEALKAEGRKQGWDYLELRGDVHKLDIAEPSLKFYNHVVDLSDGGDAVFSHLSSANRRAIRKAEKVGVRIEQSTSLAALRGFYDLQFITRKRHGLPPQPFRFFEKLRDSLIAPGTGTIISAYCGDKLAASAIYLEQGDTVHYKYGASDKCFQESRCNNLVMWSAMKLYSKRGFKRMDLGRNSISNAGLRRYKLSWGATEDVVSYHRYDLKKNRTIPMKDDVFGWHNAVFKRLPDPVLKLAGRLLYKHIA